MALLDLHVHTTSSDGQYTPTEVLKKAKNVGIDIIAITDHDTTKGIDEAIEAAKTTGIKVIPGVEISAEFKNQLHLLGYLFDYHNQKLNDCLNEFVKGKNLRNEMYVKCFNELGINITMQEAEKIAKGGVIGKPHFATVLKRKGIISDIREAYDNYLLVEPFKSIQMKKILPKEAIKLVHEAGGIVVLAHPILTKLEDDELESFVEELVGYGLDGIEVYHSRHDKSHNEKYTKLAEKYSLIVTAGSDFHGELVKPDVKLGTGVNNNVNIQDTRIVDNMKKRAEWYKRKNASFSK